MPITILLFLITEGILAVFFRFLAMYLLVVEGLPNLFEENFGLYWGVLGLLVGLYFIMSTLKCYCLEISILNSNEQIH